MILGRIASLVIAAASVFGAVGAEELRKWTDSTGRHTFRGSFVSIGEGGVKLRGENGKALKLPLEKLSDADQKVAIELGLKGYWGLDVEDYVVTFTKYAAKLGGTVDDNIRESARATVMDFDESGNVATNSFELGKVISMSYKVEKPQEGAKTFVLTINFRDSDHPDFKPQVLNARIDGNKLHYSFSKQDAPDSIFIRITKDEFEKRKAVRKGE